MVWWGKFSWCKKIGIAYFTLAVWGCLTFSTLPRPDARISFFTYSLYIFLFYFY
nr:MAG TPA: hypothetical protein [Caudoviricetes sp.]